MHLLNKIATFLTLSFLVTCNLIAQNVQLKFNPTLFHQQIIKDQWIISTQMDSIKITTFKMYIGQLAIIHKRDTIWLEKDKYRLIDLFSDSAISLSIPTRGLRPKGVKLFLQIGVDSAHTDVDSFSGDLHPSYGMYWTWQSGHINVKIEGSSNRCDHAEKNFMLHFGGYQYPYAAWVNKVIPIANRDKKITIICPIDDLIQEQLNKKCYNIMSPGNEAVKGMNLLRNKMFRQ